MKQETNALGGIIATLRDSWFLIAFIGGLIYFSEQNSTFLPSKIILVVLTAHIFPHIEQVWRSAGGVLSK